MGMSKKDFIALADAIREYNEQALPAGTNTVSPIKFGHTQLLVLADFCKGQNPRFMQDRWLDYIAGKCSPNGGNVKTPKKSRFCHYCGVCIDEYSADTNSCANCESKS